MKSELKAKLIAFIITILVVTCGVVKNNILIDKQKFVETNQLLAMESYNYYDIELDLNVLVLNNKDMFDFYTNMFGIKLSDLKESIILDNDGRLNYTNIGNTNKEYDSLEKSLIDYLFTLRKNKPNLFTNTYNKGSDFSKKYVYGLISYYSNIYDNVDFAVLASIAYIESGDLNAKYMLSCNNIYGGMSSNGLLKYQNIEYGVLVYVKMMSERYYAKGLDTVEKIASRYNPGSTTWVGKVNSRLSRFADYNTITNISDLEGLK